MRVGVKGEATQAVTAAEAANNWLAGGRVSGRGRVQAKQADKPDNRKSGQAGQQSARVARVSIIVEGRRRREERLLARNKVGVPRGW